MSRAVWLVWLTAGILLCGIQSVLIAQTNDTDSQHVELAKEMMERFRKAVETQQWQFHTSSFTTDTLKWGKQRWILMNDGTMLRLKKADTDTAMEVARFWHDVYVRAGRFNLADDQMGELFFATSSDGVTLGNCSLQFPKFSFFMRGLAKDVIDSKPSRRNERVGLVDTIITDFVRKKTFLCASQ